jgi:alkyl sulfatase BDS1-like metallo-beta-lactamase superfamily hydrolase
VPASTVPQQKATPQPGTEAPAASNAGVLQELPFQDKQDFMDAARGFIAPLPDNGVVKDAQGHVVRDISRFQFATDQPAAADALQRPLRSRFQARLSRSVRRQSGPSRRRTPHVIFPIL